MDEDGPAEVPEQPASELQPAFGRLLDPAPVACDITLVVSQPESSGSMLFDSVLFFRAPVPGCSGTGASVLLLLPALAECGPLCSIFMSSLRRQPTRARPGH